MLRSIPHGQRARNDGHRPATAIDTDSLDRHSDLNRPKCPISPTGVGVAEIDSPIRQSHPDKIAIHLPNLGIDSLRIQIGAAMFSIDAPIVRSDRTNF